MFLGEYEYKVDEKGRVPIPPKFRQELKGEVVLGPGEEKCIQGWSTPAFQKLSESLSSDPLPPAKIRKLRRAIVSTSFPLEIDGQGRVMIPNNLRNFMGIKDSVVINGTGNGTFEMWSPELWAAERTSALEQSFQLVEEKGQLQP